MVEEQVSGAVVGPVCDPQVAVSDPAVQLLLDGALLQDTSTSLKRRLGILLCVKEASAADTSASAIRYLRYRPLVHERPDERLHVFVQLLKHVWLGEVNRGSVVHVQAVGYCIVAACGGKRR